MFSKISHYLGSLFYQLALLIVLFVFMIAASLIFCILAPLVYKYRVKPWLPRGKLLLLTGSIIVSFKRQSLILKRTLSRFEGIILGINSWFAHSRRWCIWCNQEMQVINDGQKQESRFGRLEHFGKILDYYLGTLLNVKIDIYSELIKCPNCPNCKQLKRILIKKLLYT